MCSGARAQTSNSMSNSRLSSAASAPMNFAIYTLYRRLASAPAATLPTSHLDPL
jgi:hypothetical protein